MGSRRKISLKSLLDIKQYPQDQQDVLTLYAEGHSLADYLVQRGGKPQYIRLMSVAHEKGWATAFRSLYGYSNIEVLEQELDQWVIAGSPKLNLPDGVQLAENDRRTEDGVTIRGQSPESSARLGEPSTMNSAVPQVERNSREVAQTEPRRSRAGLETPLLTVDRLTTNAAKVPQE
jgi:hypothetical protein